MEPQALSSVLQQPPRGLLNSGAEGHFSSYWCWKGLAGMAWASPVPTSTRGLGYDFRPRRLEGGQNDGMLEHVVGR